MYVLNSGLESCRLQSKSLDLRQTVVKIGYTPRGFVRDTP